MNHETQLALLDRINAHRAAGRGTDTDPRSTTMPTAVYTDVERFEAERRMIARQPNLVALSGLLPGPNTFATVLVGDSPVVLTRDADGELAAMLNVCSHRGAEVAEGCGEAQRLACPYHGWTYHLDGSSAARRRGEYFDDVTPRGLTRLPVLESNGLIWVSADPAATIGERPLHGAEEELAPFDLEGYRLFAARSFTRPLNWKLVVDTFCEAYHVGSLHRTSLAPLIHSDYAVFDRFGPHGRMVATRRSIDELDDQPRSEWSLLEHATILWFLAPGTVLIHQQDHIQLYQSRPGSSPDEAHLTVSLYVPADSTRSEHHWSRNFELLIDVTDTEDFTTAAGMQRGFHTNAHDSVVFGRNEPALQHFHRCIEELISPPTRLGTSPHH